MQQFKKYSIKYLERIRNFGKKFCPKCFFVYFSGIKPITKFQMQQKLTSYHVYISHYRPPLVTPLRDTGRWFNEALGRYKCSKTTRGDNQVNNRPNHQKKIFDFILSIFFKMKFKNNVCFNLTPKTSKYHLDVSQLSDQCLNSFLLRLLTKKSKHFFFRKFSRGSLKNHISNLRSKSQKVLEFIVRICMS
jgi:hypothetical protein